MSELEKIAKQMVAKGKGILAADESTGTMTKRLSSVNVESTSENRLKFRETLFSAEGMKNHISGVILYDETIKQKTSSGKSIPDLIESFGSIPGIKVDTGAKKLSGSSEEKITEGLDGLRERLAEYYKLGARFTKWRAVYNISNKYPSELAVKSNAHALARYAALVQESKMVPIVEPEVLMDGEHDITKCYEVTSKVLKECYKELKLHNVNLKGTILKPNMILPGQGVTSMFNFGQSFGVIKGVCSALSLPIYFVRPTKWKKHFNLIKTNKDASRTRVIEIYPGISSKLARKKDSNKADAILIARYFNDTQL